MQAMSSHFVSLHHPSSVLVASSSYCIVVDVLCACRELEDHFTDSCQLLGSQSNVGTRDLLDTRDTRNLTPSATQRSEVNTPSPLPRARRQTQHGLRLSSSMNGAYDIS